MGLQAPRCARLLDSCARRACHTLAATPDQVRRSGEAVSPWYGLLSAPLLQLLAAGSSELAAHSDSGSAARGRDRCEHETKEAYAPTQRRAVIMERALGQALR